MPNNSFEEKSACPTTAGQLSLSIGWMSATAGTPDYFHECNPPIFVPPDTYFPHLGVPENTLGTQSAYSGIAYAGFYCFNWVQHNMREYIQIELSDTIIKRRPYKVSFYVSLADNGRYSVNTIGAYFSETPIYQNDHYNFNYVPQVKNTSANPLTDKDNWMLITDTFSSDTGGERYITIGNFSDDEHSDTIYHYWGDTSYVWSYYYIDDVSVIPLDSLTGMKEEEQNQFTLYPNPNTGNFIVQLNEIQKNVVVGLYDMNGRKVYEKKENSLTKQLSLNAAGLRAGIYSIMINFENGIASWQKIVISP